MENSFHTNDMNVASPLYELSGVFSGLKPTKMSSRIDHMYEVSLQCGSFHVFSELTTDRISCHSVNTHKVFLQCGSSHVFSGVLTD